MPPDQTPLLDLGDGPAFIDAYREAFRDLYESSPVEDRWGRRVVFPKGILEHICKYDRDEPLAWRQDRAVRIPWISVALTFRHAQLKLNKEQGRWNYLVAMWLQADAGPVRDYYKVVVEPRKAGTEVVLITAYPVPLSEWTRDSKLPSVAVTKKKGGGK